MKSISNTRKLHEALRACLNFALNMHSASNVADIGNTLA